MVTLDRIKTKWRSLVGPAPLDEFDDYDEYWDRRGPAGSHVYYRWIAAADLLPDEGTLLDVGCGDGGFLSYLRTRRPNLGCKGVDISERSVELTRRAGFEAEVVDPLREDLGGPFDCITCFEVLEHVPDAEVLLRKMRDACRGQLLATVPNVGYIGCRLRLGLFGRFPLTCCVCHVKEHVRFWTVRDFRQWAEHEGWRVERVLGVRGLKFTPWQRWPALWASGAMYVLAPSGRD